MTIPTNSGGRILVSDKLQYQGVLNRQWGLGPLPDAYPFSNGFVTTADTGRVLPVNTGPGSQTLDPRASGGYGNANYKILPSRADLFDSQTLIGGSSINTGKTMSWVQTISSVVLVVLALWVFLKRV